MDTNSALPRPTFIDLFSGCGGLSLGLSQAGWQGVFAIERAADAFETFRANFLEARSRYPFQWPQWLEQRAHSIDEVLENHRKELEDMCGAVDLIAGGPPCQGFSFAGKRNAADPRNKMFERYVSFVDIVRPRFLVLENVPGMQVAHATRNGGRKQITYYTKLLDALVGLGYEASGGMELDSSEFGVPQRRKRLVVVGIRSDVAGSFPTGYAGIFEKIRGEGKRQLAMFGAGSFVSAKDAISDLELGTGKVAKQRVVEYSGDGARTGSIQLGYVSKHSSAYQAQMNKGVPASRMDSMRLARHRKDVEARFAKILGACRRGVNLSSEDRWRFGMLKHRTVPMAHSQPAPTLTTLPDDILHYNEPRILTVRECARLQSFPDWFVFKGKYTTGGDRRRVECPRYTQVGNAVPPLLARAVGVGIKQGWQEIAKQKPDPGKRKIRLIKKSVVAES